MCQKRVEFVGMRLE
uniref:Uncharacterized protein n=1 Tax=Rhizophora mucronata TaxID=61149 RepID=A0A2P2J1E2_RHIMU